jgi:S-adenosylmethionine decarboxylase
MWEAAAVGASGIEWVIEAHGCEGAGLADLPKVRALFDDLVSALDLHPVAEPLWRQFPTTGGITGLCLLAESHLACHTFPEHQSICLNVFCCHPRPDWDFAGYFEREFGATSVNVRRIERPYTNERESRQLSELRRANQVPLV